MKLERIRMTKTLSVLVSLSILLSALSLTDYTMRVHASETGLKTVTLQIDGMTCGACPVAVKKALEGLDGVRKAEVSFSKEEAVVYFDERKTNIKQMIETVSKVGFRAVEKPVQRKREAQGNHGRK